MSRFRSEPVPATGFSIGVSRLLAALEYLGKIKTKAEHGPVVVTVFDKDRVADYQAMVAALRQAGIRAELYLGSGKFGPQMKYADRRNSPCVVIQGSDEKSKGEVTIKDLDARRRTRQAGKGPRGAFAETGRSAALGARNRTRQSGAGGAPQARTGSVMTRARTLLRYPRLLVLLVCCSVALAGSAAMAQPFPSKLVKLLVPQAPGGATDVFARKTEPDARRENGDSR